MNDKKRATRTTPSAGGRGRGTQGSRCRPPWIADSHRAIDPLIDEIAPPIGERQIEPQQRMPLRDIEQRGQRPTPPERYGQAHAQRAARLLATVCDHASCSTRSTAATAACAPPYRLAPCST
ncbi:hypothetical protein AQ758_16920 [Burkholderia pseudomallei]|nr:hypothetical protein AQ740_27155 [Burkholderia pseudomallei]OMT40088.1 hypothetical protein AQ758_16920 [Burkholderia pseudomallei]OMT45938.1 hypothetical protein AQ759_09305 [Burkholderia pseudomallei]OND88552.1 hypothetical protein AQ942_19265 [Burkholderia pseudomallei]ONE52931.1 hypothetical protein AQ951_26425 [Burkholderia pseudomallei]